MAISVGIIGCGAVTNLMYAPLFKLLPQVKVTAVSDADPDRAKATARHFGAEARTVPDLCARVDCVIVATPPSTHFEIADMALAKQASLVVVEKPFVTSARDARLLIDTARHLDKRLYVAHFRRVFPQVRLARRVYLSGVLGPCEKLEMHEGAPFGWAVQSNYIQNDRAGGVLWDTGSHTLDMALYATGWDEGSVEIQVQQVIRDRPEPSHDIQAVFSLQGAGQTTQVTLHCSRHQMLANLLRLHCQHGTMEINTLLSDYVRLIGPRGTMILPVADELVQPEQAFVLQYQRIFDRQGDDEFLAARFGNQVAILESLLQYVH